jgi:excisionase family DNA binding protein
MNENAALTVRGVAELLSVDSKTVYRLAQKGELPGFKVAGSWRFMRDDIETWIEAQKSVPRDQRRNQG